LGLSMSTGGVAGLKDERTVLLGCSEKPETEVAKLRRLLEEKQRENLRLDTINKGQDREYNDYRVETKIKMDQMMADLKRLLEVKGQMDHQYNITKTANTQLFELNQNLLTENKQLKAHVASYIEKITKLKSKLKKYKSGAVTDKSAAKAKKRQKSPGEDNSGDGPRNKVVKKSYVASTKFPDLKHICRTVQRSPPPLPPPSIESLETVEPESSGDSVGRKVSDDSISVPDSHDSLNKSWKCNAPLSESSDDDDEKDKYVKYNTTGVITVIKSNYGFVENREKTRYYFMLDEPMDLRKGDTVKFDVIKASEESVHKEHACNLRMVTEAVESEPVIGSTISKKLKSRLG